MLQLQGCEDHAGQRGPCNLLAGVVAQRTTKTPETKSERRMEAVESRKPIYKPNNV